MQNETVQNKGCLNPSLEHRYEFEIAESGVHYQKCIFCDDVVWMYEDASL